jgi:hypothetical protein
MKSWVQRAILGAAWLVAPADQRAAWLDDWQSELWYVPEDAATRFCLGAFPDAFWLRRNHKSPVRRNYLESPVRCVGLLAAAAALSIFVATRLQSKLPFPQAHGAAAVDGFLGMLFIYLLLAVVGLAVGDRRPAPNSHRLRGWIFLTLKILLTFPILQCTMLIGIAIAPFFSLAFFFENALIFRWIFMDQRRRCPVCLRLLTQPVRIGNSSQTFLEWYGAESACSRGHGLLHDPDILASYSAQPQWLKLDRSWSGLFSGASMPPASMQ